MVQNKTRTDWVRQTLSTVVYPDSIGGPHYRNLGVCSELRGPNGAQRNASNWGPSNFMDTLQRASDTRAAYIRVVRETMAKFVDYCVRNRFHLPDSYIEASTTRKPVESLSVEAKAYVGRESYSMATNYCQSVLGEIAGREWCKEQFDRVFPTLSDAVSEIDGFESVERLEKTQGVDIVALRESGEVVTVQVKTGRTNFNQYDGEAEVVILVDTESNTVVKQK